MNFLADHAEIDRIVPGVTDAYQALRDSSGNGIYTSLGAFYNHTVFGRDVAISAKFVSDFDHETVWGTIATLASLQGVMSDPRTQEQPGRIHHEFRDLTTWQARPMERFGMGVVGGLWGMKSQQILTYFAGDTTANYIRLVHKYARHIDESILDRQVACRDGLRIPLAVSVERAADWIVSHVDDEGFFIMRRTNRSSLPYQTFQDSVTAYSFADTRPIDTSRPHGFVETQAFALDALHDAALLLPEHGSASYWRETADRMREALLAHYWRADSQFFASAMTLHEAGRQFSDVPNIAAGWTLNTSLWSDIAETDQQTFISAITRRLFHNDFLTTVGLRTRSTQCSEPIGRHIDYHGSRTVWPMFNFMVIEGLRRHGLYRLAHELETRLINGVNAIGRFPEFMIVDHDGVFYKPDKAAHATRSAQMIPEVNIAFTVVPMLTMAYRRHVGLSTQTADGWRSALEDEILGGLSMTDLVPIDLLSDALRPTPLRLTRLAAGLRSAWHIAPVIVRKPV